MTAIQKITTIGKEEINKTPIIDQIAIPDTHKIPTLGEQTIIKIQDKAQTGKEVEKDNPIFTSMQTISIQVTLFSKPKIPQIIHRIPEPFGCLNMINKKKNKLLNNQVQEESLESKGPLELLVLEK